MSYKVYYAFWDSSKPYIFLAPEELSVAATCGQLGVIGVTQACLSAINS